MDKNKKLNAEDIDKVSGGFEQPVEQSKGVFVCGKCGQTLKYDGGMIPFERYHCINPECSEYDVEVLVLDNR